MVEAYLPWQHWHVDRLSLWGRGHHILVVGSLLQDVAVVAAAAWYYHIGYCIRHHIVVGVGRHSLDCRNGVVVRFDTFLIHCSVSP